MLRECGLKKEAEDKLPPDAVWPEGERDGCGGQMPNFESWLNACLSLRANGYQAGEGQDHAVQYD